MNKSNSLRPFPRFMKSVLAPGPLTDNDGKPLDVQSLDEVRGLGGMNRRINDNLSELELWPLPVDDVPLLTEVAVRAVYGPHNDPEFVRFMEHCATPIPGWSAPRSAQRFVAEWKENGSAPP